MDAVQGHTLDLSAALRRATKQAHAEAERAGVMPTLLQGRLPLADYRRLLQNLRAIYAELERGLLHHRDHPCVAPVCMPELFREAALAADLQTLGDGGAGDATLVPAAQAYRQRLQALGASDPLRLVAHAYVRYLGDLSGGQILARLVARSYGLANGDGTRFYAFGSAEVVAAHAHALRSGLNTLPASTQQVEHIIDEALLAFAWHGELFRQLEMADPTEPADHAGVAQPFYERSASPRNCS